MKTTTTPNIMKKIVLLLLFATGMANAQIIPFPDDNFRAAIINSPFAMDLLGNFTTVDQNLNGQVEFSEAANISILVVDNSNVINVTGIQAFVNLEEFSCAGNQIATIDLTGMTTLTFLGCSNNTPLTSLILSGLNQLDTLDFTGTPNLSHLDVSGCSALQYNILVSHNNLTYLNASNCSTLYSINVTSNQLAYLNVDGCTGLNNLSVWYSQLSMLIIANMPNLNVLQVYQNPSLSNLLVLNCPVLTTFDCNNNNLSSIDVSGLTSLTDLRCSYNPLTSIFVSNLVNLTNLYVGDTQITSLDVSNLTNLTYLWYPNNPQLQVVYQKNGQYQTTILDNNPNLDFICVDDVEIGEIQSSLNAAGMSGTVANSYCSFVPGGSYNTITGIIRMDANVNGCDASDTVKPNIRVNINDGTNQGATFTNAAGVYKFYTQAGSFTVTPVAENPTWFNFAPTTATIPFANNNNNITTQNFCITANGSHQDLEVVIEPITPARPGFDATYRIVYRNKGNTTVSGSVNFTFNDAKIDYVSATTAPNTVATGSLTWNYTNLPPFENRSFVITLNINSPVETPAVNIGDVLIFGATINPTAADELIADNTFAYNQTVVGAFDPNNIACIEGPNVAPTEIGKYLHYAVNFENTGNFVAQNVVVKDVINATKYDINSLQLQNTSHPAYTRVIGNIVEFIFENINLAPRSGTPPVGGHGDVLFKIKSKNTLIAGDFVTKTAKIYFDYNAPISTNNAQTTFATLGNTVHQLDNSINIFPNPANSIINIECNSIINSIELYDIQGRILQTDLSDSNITVFDVSNRPKGLYFLKINTDNGSKVEKLVKD
jgi:hypothetical protein